MRIGILTGGGDAPGVNACIRAIVRKGMVHGAEMLGFRNGWRGVMEGGVRELTVESVQGILHRGGTILGSSGANPYHEAGIGKVRQTFADLALDGLIAIGGEGTLGAAAHMSEEDLPVVGVPKTIDNDLSGTDACIGFRTAVQIATDAIDRLHSTAESHNRVMVTEVMGRSSGWIAVSAGLAGGADMILIPERPSGGIRARGLPCSLGRSGRAATGSLSVSRNWSLPRTDSMCQPCRPCSPAIVASSSSR